MTDTNSSFGLILFYDQKGHVKKAYTLLIWYSGVRQSELIYDR